MLTPIFLLDPSSPYRQLLHMCIYKQYKNYFVFGSTVIKKPHYVHWNRRTNTLHFFSTKIQGLFKDFQGPYINNSRTSQNESIKTRAETGLGMTKNECLRISPASRDGCTLFLLALTALKLGAFKSVDILRSC